MIHVFTHTLPITGVNFELHTEIASNKDADCCELLSCESVNTCRLDLHQG